MADGNEDANVKVMIRVRPPNKRELGLGYEPCLSVEQNAIRLHTRPDPRVFTFDRVAGPDSSQRDIFDSVGQPLVDGCLDGYNGTVFAYGQTGSGKTYTMLGPAMNVQNGEQRGLIPRMFEYLFRRTKEIESEGQVQFLCKCSYLEIYNEQISDLLTGGSDNLNIRQSIGKGPYVEGLHEQVVTNPADTAALLIRGNSNRHVASTGMNKESSRSHSVFTVTVESKTQTPSGVTKVRMSRLNLIDLAGSERQKMTKTKGIALKEASNINKSLSALGRVITALVDVANGKQRHVHYRDSKLTFLLRDSLGGNSRTFIIAAVSPSDVCFGETLGTLKFARRAKFIRNKPIVNEDMSGSITVLQDEIRRLRQEVATLKATSPCASTKISIRHELQVSANSTNETQNQESQEVPSSDEDDTTDLSSEERVIIARDERIQELENTLMRTVEHLRSAEAETERCTKRAEYLDSLVTRSNKLMQSTRMVLQFMRRHLSGDHIEHHVQELAEVVDKCIHPQNNPAVMEYVLENMELRTLLEDRLGNIDEVELTEMELEVERAKKHIQSLVEQIRQLVTDKYMLSDKLAILERNGSQGYSNIVFEYKTQIEQLQHEIENKTRSQEELSRRLEHSVEQIHQLSNERTAIERELKSAQQYANELELRLQQQEQHYQSEVRKLREERDHLEDSLREGHARELDELRQVSGATERSLETRISDFLAEHQVLQQKIHETEQELNGAQRENEDLKLTHQRLQHEFQDSQSLQEQYQLELDHKNIQLQEQHAQLERLQKTNTDLEADVKKFRCKLSEEQALREKANAATNIENDHRSNLENQVETLKEKLSKLEADNSELCETLETVQDELEYKEVLLGGAQERAQLAIQQISEMDMHIASLTDEIGRLQAQASEESDEFVQRIHDREARRRSLEQRLCEMENVRNEEFAQLQSLQRQNEHIQEERASLYAELLGWKNKCHELETAIEQQRGQNAMLEDRINNFERQEQELRNSLSAQQEKYDRLQSQSSQSACKREEELRDMQQRLEQMEHRCCTEAHEKSLLQDQLTQVYKQLENALESEDEVRRELSALRADKEYLEQNISQLQKQNAKLSGHQNPRQRIQHHIKVKEENNQLRRERIQLLSVIEEREREIKMLQSNNNKENICHSNLPSHDKGDLKDQMSRMEDALQRVCKHLANVSGAKLPPMDKCEDLVKWCLRTEAGLNNSSSMASSRSRTRTRRRTHQDVNVTERSFV